MINLIRCDDRLIHGQCMTRLVQHFKIKHIIVIDEFTAKNPAMKMVIEKLTLPNMKNEVFTQEDAIEPIKKAMNDTVGTMIVFRFIATAKYIYEQIDGLRNSLMIGPVVKRENTFTAQPGSYLTREELQILRDLATHQGIEIYFQTLPDMKRTELKDVNF